MNRILILLVFCSMFSCSQDKRPILGETNYQKEQNAKFKDASTSPLTKRTEKSLKVWIFLNLIQRLL